MGQESWRGLDERPFVLAWQWQTMRAPPPPTVVHCAPTPEAPQCLPSSSSQVGPEVPWRRRIS